MIKRGRWGLCVFLCVREGRPRVALGGCAGARARERGRERSEKGMEMIPLGSPRFYASCSVFPGQHATSFRRHIHDSHTAHTARNVIILCRAASAAQQHASAPTTTMTACGSFGCQSGS